MAVSEGEHSWHHGRPAWIQTLTTIRAEPASASVARAHIRADNGVRPAVACSARMIESTADIGRCRVSCRFGRRPYRCVGRYQQALAWAITYWRTSGRDGHLPQRQRQKLRVRLQRRSGRRVGSEAGTSVDYRHIYSGWQRGSVEVSVGAAFVLSPSWFMPLVASPLASAPKVPMFRIAASAELKPLICRIPSRP